MLKSKLIKIICAGSFKMLLILFAPRYCATIAEMAERVCAKIQTIAEINDPAIPTAAKASVGFIWIFPTMAVSVIDNKGSAIPEIIAGIASLLISLKDIFILFFN